MRQGGWLEGRERGGKQREPPSPDRGRVATTLPHLQRSPPPPTPTPHHSRRIFTLLRSPHVNKDSREQFQQLTHSRLLDVKGVTSETVDKLMACDIPAGVDVEIKI